MKKYAIFVLAIVLISCADKPEKGTLVIDVNVLDVTSGEIREHQDVVIDSGTIKSISAHRKDLKVYETMVHGKGKYIMPGLTEMHAHIPHPSKTNDQIEDVLLLYLANGITTVRGMLGHPSHLVLRSRAEFAELLSPRIYTSSPSLNGKSVTSAEEAIATVTTYEKDGYDFLKIHPGIKKEVFDQIVKTANVLDIAIAGHVPADVGIRHALKSNYASIDHIDGFVEGLVPESEKVHPGDNGFFGYALTPFADPSLIDGLVSLTKEHEVWVVPTQSLFERWFAPIAADSLLKQPEMRYMPTKTLQAWKKRKNATIAPATGFSTNQWQHFVALRKQLIQKLQQGGYGLLLGSDAPQVFNVPGFSIHREIDGLLGAGLTPLEIIQSGTLHPAEFFDKETVLGQVKEGFVADLILLDANPLENIDHLQDLSGVFRNGRFIPKIELNKRLTAISKKYGHAASNASATDTLAARLRGSWKYYSQKGKKPAPSTTFEMIKTIDNGFWSMTETNILTHKMDSYQGGSYCLDGPTYSETTNFANSSSRYLLGETLAFEWEIKGDTLIYTGIDTDKNEVWVRVE